MQDALDHTCLLEFNAVAKTFRTAPFKPGLRALDGVSFTVEAGRIVGLVGPNGSGKTTAFRIAAGLLNPNQGSVAVLGAAPGTDRSRTRTGYMPEQPGLPANLTPREILHFIGRVFGMDAAARADRIRELTDLLDLADYLDRKMGKLSKGMSKRAGLATALFNRPKLLLLDEPLEGLDPIGSSDVKGHLEAMAREGTGILISSHILTDVEAICGRIVILHEGRVMVQGDREAILAARDRMEIRFQAPGDGELLDDIRRTIEARGGTVEFAGHPREELETLFRKLVGSEAPLEKGKRP
jgi:ABC-type multidrug transport system ATPase subunit